MVIGESEDSTTEEERKSGAELLLRCVICPVDGRMDSELLSSFLFLLREEWGGDKTVLF